MIWNFLILKFFLTPDFQGLNNGYFQILLLPDELFEFFASLRGKNIKKSGFQKYFNLFSSRQTCPF